MFSSCKYWFLFILLLGIGLQSFGQTDTTKVSSKKIDTDTKVLKSTTPLNPIGIDKKKRPVKKADLNIGKRINTDAISKNLNSKTKQPDPYFMMETRPEDRDIMGLKYWNNKDVTHKKLESHMSLGTVNTSSNTVRVECRDYSLVDGDRIQIFHNETSVSTNIGLKANYYVVYLTLKPGYNRVDFQALNQGYSGPNTAEVLLYDHKGNLLSSKEWSLATRQVATLGVIKY